MQPSAHIDAAIEVIDSVLLEESVPADNLLTSYFRNRRYIGSQDRKAISEVFYQILRHKIIIEAVWKSVTSKKNATGRDLMLTGLSILQKRNFEIMSRIFNGDAYGPRRLSDHEEEILKKLAIFPVDQLSEAEQYNLQNWQLQELKQHYEDLPQLLKSFNCQASLDLRINSLKTTLQAVQKQFEKEKIQSFPGRYSPLALRLPDRRPLSKHPLWTNGSIEVQDEGSQIIAYLVDAKPGQSVLDYCAGAGGKTLAIAATMHNKGRLVATDTLDWRLQRSRKRCKRAGVHNVEYHVLNESAAKWLKRQQGKFDRVLVDVPCSGSGTWRRNPDLKWRLQESQFQELITLQTDILAKAAKLVKNNGRLIYSTCSLFHSENLNQIDSFLAINKDFSLKSIPEIWPQFLLGNCPTADYTLQLRPDIHNVDGFFIAVMERQLVV